jgi:hypothetical protein
MPLVQHVSCSQSPLGLALTGASAHIQHFPPRTLLTIGARPARMVVLLRVDLDNPRATSASNGPAEVISRRVLFAIVQGVGTITRQDDDASLCRKASSGAIDWWWSFGLAVSSILLALAILRTLEFVAGDVHLNLHLQSRCMVLLFYNKTLPCSENPPTVSIVRAQTQLFNHVISCYGESIVQASSQHFESS